MLPDVGDGTRRQPVPAQEVSAMRVSFRLPYPRSAARRLGGASIAAGVVLAATLTGRAQFPIGKPPTAASVIRINVDQNGQPTCASTANTIVSVVDDINGNVVAVTFNDYPGSTTKKTHQYQAGVLEKFDVYLCGTNNDFRYQLAALNSQLSLPRTFRIAGGASSDDVTLNFYANAAGQYITMTQAPVVDIDFGRAPTGWGEDLDDTVSIKVNNIGGGTMDVAAKLGVGNDYFELVTNAKPMDGSLDLTVEGESGHDILWFDLFDYTTQLDIPEGKTVSIRASGDTLDALSSQGNVADHGEDRVQLGYRGVVDGTFTLELRGDDAVMRTVAPQCANGSCAFLCQGTGCAQPTGVEAALRNPEVWYAGDLVQAQTEFLAGSTGSVSVLVDSGIGSDLGSLVVANANPGPTSYFPSGPFQQYSTSLTLGLAHGFKNDWCYAAPVTTLTQLAIWPVPVSNCNTWLPALATIQ
jgi:hypothetical protein